MGPTGKKDRKIAKTDQKVAKKDRKIAKKDRKIAKKDRKIALYMPLSTISVPCMKIQGEHGTLPSAADAYV